MAGLFISYRRADGGWSGRLRDHLELRFGAGVVWWDLDDIRPGQRWREEIESGLKTAEAALILIGPRWLSETDAKGQKRLSKRTDVVRAEVAEALRGPAVVIPILVGGASMPEKRVLPDSIAAVTDRQAMILDDSRWKQDVDRLVEKLRDVVSRNRQPEALPALQNRLFALEREYFALLQDDPRQALDKVREWIALLDEHLPLYPTDVNLQLMRGYAYKNVAMAQRDLGNGEEFRRELQRAQQVFSVILREAEANLAGAYNGLGSVAMLRSEFRESLVWIYKALALVPDYGAALHDRDMALQFLAADREDA